MANLFSFDPGKRVEQFVAKGQFGKAAEFLAKRKNFLEAGRVAIQGKDPKAAARYFFQATVGTVEDAGDIKPLQVGGLLVAAGQLDEAVAMFELARAYDRAADVSAKQRNYAHAALNYERANKYTTAAQYYERAADFENAARILGSEARKLTEEVNDPAQERSGKERRRSLDMRRAKLFLRAGNGKKAAELIRAWPARTVQEAEMIEKVVGTGPAVDAYLSIGKPHAALRLLEQDPSADRRVLASVHRKCGNLGTAAAIYAALGEDAITAQVLEEAGKHESAGRRWEKVGKLERAATSFEKANRPLDAARCLASAGRYGRASQFYSLANEPLLASQCLLEKGDKLAAGRMLQRADREEEATEIFRQIGVRDGGYSDATLQLLPRLVEKDRDAAEALRRLNLVAVALRDPATQPEWLYWEARCLQQLQRNTEAVAAYRRLLIARSDFKDAASRLNQLEHQVVVSEVVSGSPTAATHARKSIAGSRKGSPPSSDAALDGFNTTDFEQLLEESRLHRKRSDPPPTIVTNPSSRRSARKLDEVFTDPSLESVNVGAVFANRYEIEVVLGKGGMGQVYRAHDQLLDETVAIKTVLQDSAPEHTERLIREVQICRKIAHPNVVRVHDAGRMEGGIFVTMEFIEGEPLNVLLQTDPKPELGRVRSLLRQIALGLDAAHQLEVVHRDLKPGNVMVHSIAGPTPRDLVKLVDFGIARMEGVGNTITQAGLAVGSPLYMSPEQLSGGRVDPRSDLYALGNLAFRLLVGYEPFRAENISAVLHGHLNVPAPPLERTRPDLEGAWSALIKALLGKSPNDRPASAKAVAELLAEMPIV